MEDLLAALHDPDRFARSQVATALRKVGTLDVLETLLCRFDIDMYDTDILSIIRQLTIKFNHLHPRLACLPVYLQPRLLRWFRKRLWRGRIFLNRLRRKMR
jgi:hypothetical protein